MRKGINTSLHPKCASSQVSAFDLEERNGCCIFVEHKVLNTTDKGHTELLHLQTQGNSLFVSSFYIRQSRIIVVGATLFQRNCFRAFASFYATFTGLFFALREFIFGKFLFQGCTRKDAISNYPPP